MPPKKEKKKEEPVPTPFDNLTLEALRDTKAKLTAEIDRLAVERNQAQVDRDAIERFFDITKKELREVELAVLAKEREMELMADNHRVEVKVYQQKVKHLEYEHANSMRRIGADDDTLLKEGEGLHLRREAALRSEKSSLRARVREMEDANAEAVRQMKLMHEKNLSKLKQEFGATLEQLRGKYEARLSQLRDDLRLRHKVEVHEVEERKNLHINQLMRAHEDAFAEMKRYYNDITRANLELISTLKTQISEATDKQSANQKLMLEIAEENKRLSDPLQRATAELASLQADLRDADKDRQSLAYAKTRLKSLKAQLIALQAAHLDLERRYAEADKERTELYEKFEGTVRAAQARCEARNELLEKRLAEAEYEFTSKRTQIQEVLMAAKLDPAVLATVGARLDAVLESRNGAIRELQSCVARLSKAHNDAVRVFEARLRDMGVPATELHTPLLPTATGVGPAGLVAVPSVP